MEAKDALKLYEDGKHRRYALLFAVNGGAFAIAKLIREGGNNNIGGLSQKALSVGLILFTLAMVWDIFKFGERSRKLMSDVVSENDLNPDAYGVFGKHGVIVLIIIGALICIGWLLVALGPQPTPPP